MTTMTKTIEGMSCGNCVRHVTEAIEGVAGVKRVSVSLEQKSATIESDSPIDDALLRRAVEEAGYTLKDAANTNA
ncbi:MAG: heavy-metal-associated domain-containing protein [Ilumatobacteraceae bacterium]